MSFAPNDKATYREHLLSDEWLLSTSALLSFPNAVVYSSFLAVSSRLAFPLHAYQVLGIRFKNV